MANPVLKKDEKEDQKTFDASDECLSNQNSYLNGDVFNSLQHLDDEAARLIEQKANLSALLSQLENKAKTKVEKRKQEVERLNSEVLDLKRRCEKLTCLVNSK